MKKNHSMKKIIQIALLSILPTVFFSQNTALQFDGLGDYVQTGFNGISDSSSRTVQCWYKGSTSGSQRFLVDMGVTSGGNGARFSVKINPTWSTKARVEIGGGGIDGTTTITNNVWHQITVVYDNTATTNRYKIYIDGLFDAQGDISIPLNTPVTSTNPLTIGIRTDLNSGTDLSGSLDEVRIWNIALTPAQITANWNKEICGTPTGLVAYYKMNEGNAGATNTSITSLIDEITPASVNTLIGFNKTGATSNYTAHTIASPGNTSSASVTVCDSYTSPTGKIYTATGWYNDTIQRVGACDSIITTNVVVQAFNAGNISSNAGAITVSASGNKYQWLDCNNSNMPTSAVDTNQNYSPTTNGSYACVVTTSNGCIDTTACFSYNSVGVNSNSSELTWSVYPNPASGSVFVNLPEGIKTTTVKIIDAQGKLVMETTINQSTFKIDVSELTNGIYQMALISGNKNSTKAIVINN